RLCFGPAILVSRAPPAGHDANGPIPRSVVRGWPMSWAVAARLSVDRMTSCQCGGPQSSVIPPDSAFSSRLHPRLRIILPDEPENRLSMKTNPVFDGDERITSGHNRNAYATSSSGLPLHPAFRRSFGPAHQPPHRMPMRPTRGLRVDSDPFA